MLCLCYVMFYVMLLRYVTLCYVMLCYVMSCYVIGLGVFRRMRGVMLCYVVLCCVMLCYVGLGHGDLEAAAREGARGRGGERVRE